MAGDLAEGTGFMQPVLARGLALAGRADEAAGASPYQAATVHLALGERERALELLSAAADEHDPWIVLAAVDPMMATLRGEPAYLALVARVRGSR